MFPRKILLVLFFFLIALASFPWIHTEAWLDVRANIEVIVDDPSTILTVDLLIPLEEAPLLLDDTLQPIDHPLNGVLTADGYGSATLYSSDIVVSVSDDSTHWSFLNQKIMPYPFYAVVIETNREFNQSDSFRMTSTSAVISWNDGMYSFQAVTWDMPMSDDPRGFQVWNLLPYLVVLLIALLDFPLLFVFGYRTKKMLLFGGLIHLGATLSIAVLNRMYHVSGKMAFLYVIVVALAIFTVVEAVWFALRFEKHSTAKTIVVSMAGMFVSSLLLFLYMGSGVF
jgi:hypothetical protein